MGVTVKVNGTDNGVVHKGSGHRARCTAPDVCKTPSPGGPVPVPYPVIMSQSSDLTNGTTTVKADGEMVAVKDCEYSRCSGDEAGTAGGVVSSTNMKEAKFILFSFDVKMDGKNACRNHDKMTMNHQNTICMMGTDDEKTKTETLELTAPDCSEQRDGKDRWDKCQKEEMCRMVEEFNKVKKEDIEIKRPSPGDPDSEEFGDYTKSLDNFEDNFAKLVETEPADEKAIRDQFYSECRYKQWNEGNPEGKPPPPVPARSPRPPRSSKSGGGFSVNPDHVHDAGLGGSLTDLKNCKWVNSKVNKSLGKSLGHKASSGDYKPGMKLVLKNCKC
jgi:hypothetical protein